MGPRVFRWLVSLTSGGFWLIACSAHLLRCASFNVSVKQTQQENSPTHNFLTRLDIALKKAGLNRQGLAKALGVAPSTLTRWNHGAEPRMGVIADIARLANVRREWLSAGIEPMEEAKAPSDEVITSANALSSWEEKVRTVAELGKLNALTMCERALARMEADPGTVMRELPSLKLLIAYLKTEEVTGTKP